MGVQYRISEGVLLKNQNGLLWALVNGKWRDYPEITRDWFTNSIPIDRDDLAKRLGAGKPSDGGGGQKVAEAGYFDEFDEPFERFDTFDTEWGGGAGFPETNAGVGPGSFGNISGYNPNAAGLIGERKRKQVTESAPHDVASESRDNSGKWTSGGSSSGASQPATPKSNSEQFYHGTWTPHTGFTKSKGTFYVTPDKEYAASYRRPQGELLTISIKPGARIFDTRKPADMEIARKIISDDPGMGYFGPDQFIKKKFRNGLPSWGADNFIDAIKALGYDGMRLNERYGEKPVESVAIFNPDVAHVDNKSKGVAESIALQESAGQHAPKGGATLAGKQFKGGEFIPGATIDNASPAERQVLKQKQAAAKIDQKTSPAAKGTTSHEPNRPASAAAARQTPAQPAAQAQPRAVQNGRGVPGRAAELEHASPADPQNAKVPLAGLPRQVKIAGKGYETGPFAPARLAAIDYMKSAGLDYHPPATYAKLNKERAKQIAQEFDKMADAPNDPKVKAAYRALIDETLAQYQAIKKTGLKIDFIDFAKQGDPYAASPRLAEKDVKENNHLWVFPTTGGFGSNADFDASKNPLLEPTKEVINGHQLCANDVFRIVHDYFGHIKEGNGFRAEGEENAWRCHSAMYSPLAREAMTSETRGQNSWVNYGPHGDKNRTASAADTIYADQKVGLLPAWCMRDGSGQPGDPDLAKPAGEPTPPAPRKDKGQEAGSQPKADKPAGEKGPDRDLQMFSENVQEGTNFKDALAMKNTPRHAWAKEKCDEIDRKLGIGSQLEEAVGDWKDGAESSFIARSHGSSLEQLEYAAAVKGFFLKQKGVIAFKEDQAGPDAIYELEIKAPAEDVRKTLQAHGIEFRTIALHGETTHVTIFDAGRKLTEHVSDVADHYGDRTQDYRQIDGHGKYIGADDRAGALAEYRRVIAGREKTLAASQRYRDARGRGFADYWGRAQAGPTVESAPLAEAAPPDLRAAIAAAAADTNTDPTPGQIEAGTYKKGRFTWNQLKIALENPKGSVRRGTDADGNEWEQKMGAHYGYISKSDGADGDEIDIFMGPDPESELVFVIDQKKPDGSFDEHKAVLGALTEDQARDLYLSCYEDGWQGLGAITAMTLPQFKAWLFGDTSRPVGVMETAPQDHHAAGRLMQKAMSVLYGPGGVYP